MKLIVGRAQEKEILYKATQSERSELIAVYGRRRVGKTFLIRTFFNKDFTFKVTGIANASLQQQLTNFNFALQSANPKLDFPLAKDWIESFQELTSIILKSRKKKKIIFIDELPWFDTANSKFVQALEHFWNSFASARNDIILIICGSAASWMLNKIINNHGGLHNRVTKRIKLEPFTLNECQQLLNIKHIQLDQYQIARLYLAIGGIPFYWEEVEAGLSADQNIQEICFSPNGLLKNEFNNLFPSLFSNSEKHLTIVKTLSKKAKGLSRNEIIKLSGLTNAGSTTRIFNELEESGFIRKYTPFSKKRRQSLYQLTDFYTLFYLKFIKNTPKDSTNYWLNSFDSPKYRAWSGYAFELLSLLHVDQIKNTLGISGIETAIYSWRSKTSEQGSQIDLLIDRKDQVINLCEMKFSIGAFSISKSYARNLRNKASTFKEETKTRKSVMITFVSTFGLKDNEHSIGLVQKHITLEDLFLPHSNNRHGR
jgi:AAA+ ATPase superfamily predicted ATPase